MTSTSRFDRSALGQCLVALALASLAWWLWRWQARPWPAPTPLLQPRVAAGIAIALYAAFCGWIAWRGRTPRIVASVDGASPWRVIYASQTGFALELAERTAQALRDASAMATVHDINSIDLQALDGARCLFVVSTTGEGDPPDHAMDFVKRVMAQPADLQRTRYAVLALGDSEYTQFCAFGRELDEWLHRHGAQPLFDRVDVDNADPAALRHWQHHVGVLTGHTDQPDWTTPRYERWTLATRRLLNPGSVGGEAWHIELQAPAGTSPAWQAGDIAEIGPRNAAGDVDAFIARHVLDGSHVVHRDGEDMPLAELLARSRLSATADVVPDDARALVAALQALPHREYSIASLPADGSLHLLVRLMRREDGSPGIGSGWLCRHAAIGDGIDLRIRSNPNFHAPPASQPMVLIGNGTGLAGLRAHLKARAAIGAHRNWLLFGERNASADRLHGDELDAWQRSGVLERLDLVFSRDGHALRYVQDALHANADTLRSWVEEGAAIYACGSLEGMAPGVDAALNEILGPQRMTDLADAGRYRRDVY
ncbi:sulfite reductase subunit alpha [Thermomonas carbonis]|uniref:sulfite reductase subunit alpha n=1 Tax=Thermomonas carbonis TaxID=1463158 RepID=UPI00167C2EC4|nr:sulfite reductase flavoprotein subunit alpha [Thermomonas carbonis]GHB99133.1 sulfite reductase subunit alpha [Thermomonas carbonis]